MEEEKTGGKKRKLDGKREDWRDKEKTGVEEKPGGEKRRRERSRLETGEE